MCWGVLPDLAYAPLLLFFHVQNGWSVAVHMKAWDWSWAHPLALAPHSVVVCAVALGILAVAKRDWLAPAALGWGSHVVIDAFTHVTDAYPLLWPLSTRKFPSVVSYWTPSITAASSSC